MTAQRISILNLQPRHIERCSRIAALSDPWIRLGERLPIGLLLRKRTTKAFVCMIGRNLAGFSIFDPSPVFARGGYLRALAVAPEYRRQGIGRLLLQRTESVCATRSNHLYLCVSSFNRSAQRFYRSCGYRKIGTVPGLTDARYEEHIFWKKLSSRL